jgi:ankyrin repeat protein
VVHICDCIPARLPQALAELPKTLDETYERTLRGINEANWEFALRMFQFVSVASRPLYVEELADLLAFNFEAGSIPKFYEDWRLKKPADAVLSTCSTLLTIVNDLGSPVIQFSHFSVKEFLTSTRLAEATDIISRRYHISMTPAHTLAAQACLGILLHLDKDVTCDSLKDFSLAEYAAEHWVDHARFEDVSRNVEDGMKELFHPSKPHLAICVWICDPAVPTWNRTRNETPLPLQVPQSSLHYAASWGVHPVLEFLIIEHSQDVCSRDSTDNATPLHLASLNGHVKAACKLIEHGADLTAENNDRWTPLHLASQRGGVDVARMLIERGADLTARNNKGETPLHLASSRGNVEVARMLIEHGADMTARDNGGRTPLYLALEMGHVDVGRMLIERGADVTTQKNDGRTLLHLASQWGRVDIGRMLIEGGADVTAQENDGRTPLHLASQFGRVDIGRMLIEGGADVAAQKRDGETPLHLASHMGHVDIGRMLIERGADVSAQDNCGWTPLHLASRMGQADVASMLIERGADVTVQNKYRDTPLHFASDPLSFARISPQKCADIAYMLLEHGAYVNARDNSGSTPFVLASRRGHAETIRVLVQHGADSAN